MNIDKYELDQFDNQSVTITNINELPYLEALVNKSIKDLATLFYSISNDLEENIRINRKIFSKQFCFEFNDCSKDNLTQSFIDIVKENYKNEEQKVDNLYCSLEYIFSYYWMDGWNFLLNNQLFSDVEFFKLSWFYDDFEYSDRLNSYFNSFTKISNIKNVPYKVVESLANILIIDSLLSIGFEYIDPKTNKDKFDVKNRCDQLTILKEKFNLDFSKIKINFDELETTWKFEPTKKYLDFSIFLKKLNFSLSQQIDYSENGNIMQKFVLDISQYENYKDKKKFKLTKL